MDLFTLCTYQCVAPLPPSGFVEGFGTKNSPHYGAFDISERRPTIWGI